MSDSDEDDKIKLES